LMADKKIMIGAGAGLLFVILLLGFLLRRPKAAPMAAQLAEKAIILPGKAGEVVVGAEGSSAKQVESGAGQKTDAAEDAIKQIEEISPFLQLPEMTNHTKALLDHLRKVIAKDPDAATNVIRTWMEEV